MESTAIGVWIFANPTERNLPDYSRFQQIGADSSETKAETWNWIWRGITPPTNKVLVITRLPDLWII